MSTGFAEALAQCGVDNLDLYDAVLRSEDGSVEYGGYKAFNLVGIRKAADLEATVFNDPPGTRMVDASIESLAIDPDKAGGVLMFRLAEYVGAVVVHRKVKEFIEARDFPGIVFREPSAFVS